MGTRPQDLMPPAVEIAGLEPLRTIRSRWPAVIGALLSAAMIVGLAHALLGAGLAGLARSVPASPVFYVAFALFYLGPPWFDHVIFRRLWRIPPSGFAALLKKRVANDVVLGYSGEAYFYAWARARAPMVAAPFGAVKDVSILSGLAGNAITVAMVAVALPIAHGLLSAGEFRTVIGSAGVALAASLPFLVFSRRVFSLRRGELWWVFRTHCLRLLLGSVLIAWAWHAAMPGVAMGMWLLLAAGRLLVSRLPLVPNKDLIFANIAILLIGKDKALSELLAFVAAATLLTHIALIAGFAAHTLVQRRVV
ncbi:hypothetical protein [Sphingomonas sp.]|uniref:hypothetical protein n=1 Tax=Sphingomonas sp. TaxID=28214 RepID=UPI0035BC24F4